MNGFTITCGLYAVHLSFTYEDAELLAALVDDETFKAWGEQLRNKIRAARTAGRPKPFPKEKMEVFRSDPAPSIADLGVVNAYYRGVPEGEAMEATRPLRPDENLPPGYPAIRVYIPPQAEPRGKSRRQRP